MCSIIIPIVNTSSVSAALMNNEIDFIYSMISLGIFGVAIKYLKKNEHQIMIILMETILEDLIISLLCNIKLITYIIQIVIIILFVVYISYKNRSIES